jgi:type IV secretory pathway VirB2 component (pilin)
MEKVKALIEVKKLIALLLTIVFCFLAITGKIEAKDYLTVFLMIISFYYGQSTSRQAISENK